MLPYIVLFFVPTIVYFLFGKRNPKAKGPLFFMMLAVALFVGFADMLGGYDRYIYAELFDRLADNRQAGVPIVHSAIFGLYSKEMGYVILNWLITFITQNRYIFILILTIIMYALLYDTFKRYMTNYYLGLTIFFGLWFFFTFTYLRQVMGAVIAFTSIKYIIERKFWKFSLVMLIAFSFHNSAIIFFPMYFVPIRKFTVPQILIVMGICLLIGVSGFASNLYEIYGEATEDIRAESARFTGFRMSYLFEAVFFLFFMIRCHHRLPNDRQTIVLYNIALVFCAILLVFIKSENGGRLSWYYMGGLIVTMANLADSKYGKQIFMDWIMLVVSFLLFFRILSGWGKQIYPYKSFLTNGVRDGDYIYEQYEYDYNYARDKFYR